MKAFPEWRYDLLHGFKTFILMWKVDEKILKMFKKNFTQFPRIFPGFVPKRQLLRLKARQKKAVVKV